MTLSAGVECLSSVPLSDDEKTDILGQVTRAGLQTAIATVCEARGPHPRYTFINCYPSDWREFRDGPLARRIVEILKLDPIPVATESRVVAPTNAVPLIGPVNGLAMLEARRARLQGEDE
jgi:hypothetical protein